MLSAFNVAKSGKKPRDPFPTTQSQPGQWKPQTKLEFWNFAFSTRFEECVPLQATTLITTSKRSHHHRQQERESRVLLLLLLSPKLEVRHLSSTSSSKSYGLLFPLL